MHLRRPNSAQRLISLVSMIDVLLIMLVFFMVTSTYLDLDMIPLAKTSDGAAASSASTAPLMIRLGADGRAYVRGKATSPDALTNLVGPNRSVLILPSPRAHTQALVTIMDTLTIAGVTQIRIVQVADTP